MLRTFNVVRQLATALLLVAVIEGVAVAGLRPGLGPFFLGLAASVICVLVICALWELDG
jgi:hypothetical protein